MFPPLITNQTDFEALCVHMREAGEVGFDTEFVSESSYQSELCLLQFATREAQTAVDPLAGIDLTAWWEIMADQETRIIVHGGREEIRFCLLSINKPPGLLFDVQIAQGLLDRGFPLSYTTLVSRNLHVTLKGGETRSDWKKRPLSSKQLSYALEDVNYLLKVYDKQTKKLVQKKRQQWVIDECAYFIGQIENELATPVWQRISGVQKLKGRELVVVEAISEWREATAARVNRPRRRVLRDDLLLEIAKRHPQTVEELFSTRGLESSISKKDATELVKAIKKGMEKPKSYRVHLPPREQSHAKPDEHVLGRLLGVALANRCAEEDLSMSMVATNNDLLEFIRWHVDGRSGDKPALAEGWRHEICGSFLGDILDGKIYIRVGDATADCPLVFEKKGKEKTKE